MMKFIKSIGSLFLIMMILISTTGLSLKKHYCMGMVKSISIIDHKHCDGMDEQESSKTDCCKDSEVHLTSSIEDIQKPVNITVDFSTIEIAVRDIYFENEDSEDKSSFITNFSYKPPLLITDISVDIQSFLI